MGRLIKYNRTLGVDELIPSGYLLRWSVYKLQAESNGKLEYFYYGICPSYILDVETRCIDSVQELRVNNPLIKKLLKSQDNFKIKCIIKNMNFIEALNYLHNNIEYENPKCLNIIYGNISKLKEIHYKANNEKIVDTFTDGYTNFEIYGDKNHNNECVYIPDNFKIGYTNKDNLKILIVPDIHSKRNVLDKFIEMAVDKMGNLKYDKIIFLGDYIDGFVESDEDMLYCLNTVIEFKKGHPNDVVLLYGNHEFSYLGYPCSGHRMTNVGKEVEDILWNNRNLFQICYAINNWVYSHAGITNNWIQQYNLDDCVEYIDKDYTTNEIKTKHETIKFNTGLLSANGYVNGLHLPNWFSGNMNYRLQILTNAINLGVFDIFIPGIIRSGYTCYEIGSCIWADKKELIANSLDSHTLMDIKNYSPRYETRINQIVGHTPLKTIERIKTDNGNKLFFTDTFSTYRDGTIIGDKSYIVHDPMYKGNALDGGIKQYKLNI